MPRLRKSRAIPPLYVLRAGECCPRCGQGTNVYTLAAAGLYDAPDDSTFDGFIILKDIETLPKRMLALFQGRCHGYYFDHKHASDPPYLMNHCLRCGAQ